MPPATSPDPSPLLTLRGLCKSYATPVLQGIDLDLYPGEVHALMGANGAGKSTLAKVVCGLVPPDGGTMTLGGQPYHPRGKAAAEALGVQIVAQEPHLLKTLTVAENLGLGRWPSRLGLLRFGRLNAEAAERARGGGPRGDRRRHAGRALGVGEQQLVSIAAALARPCRLLILDEPTAALTGPQVDRLFENVARLKAEGVAIVYVSHRLDELRRIADRISVLRDGKLVATRPAAVLGLDEAVRLMVGSDPAALAHTELRQRGPVALRVEGLTRGDRVRDVSFEVHHGEVLGHRRPGRLGPHRAAADDLRGRPGRHRPASPCRMAPIPARGGSASRARPWPRASAWSPRTARPRGCCSPWPST